MSAGSDVLILPSSAHEKFTVLAEERRRKRARLTGDTPPPTPSAQTLPAEGQEAVGF